ncbi:hypothetical protein ACHAXT_009343 [Thalassiosira profunda]
MRLECGAGIANRRKMRSTASSVALLLLLLLAAEALTITTFNILAPVHRSMDLRNTRESEREDWWRPRAEGVADYISRKFASSDVVLLQEWWFDEQFTSVFNAELGDAFEMVAERRPGTDGKMRDDGMCCLINKGGQLELVKSGNVLTGPQRIAQIVQCREKCSSGGGGRDVFIANSHLSYPGDEDPVVNDQRQAAEASIILDALSKASSTWDTSHHEERLEVVCGDFNSNSKSLAASLVESPPNSFVNCVSATADRNLANIGGQVNIGTTHCDHRGLKVSVDHIFLRLARRREQKSRDDRNKRSKRNRCAALSLGYLDTKGTRILSVRRGNIQLEGSMVLSDHRPITAKIAWPRTSVPKERLPSMYINATLPLDPLEPAWGIIDD